jgi:hypothetical protein
MTLASRESTIVRSMRLKMIVILQPKDSLDPFHEYSTSWNRSGPDLVVHRDLQGSSRGR